MKARVAVLPAAPVLLPDRSRVPAPAGQAVLAACDSVLEVAARGVPEVVVVVAADHLRDLTGAGVESAAPIGARVADALLDRVGFTGARVRVLPGARTRDAEVFLLMADGSASVGEKSPRPGERGSGFDAELERCLRSGAVGGLAAVTDTDAASVGCTTAPVWRTFADLAPQGAVVESLELFAPFGVQYFVGSWNVEAGTR